MKEIGGKRAVVTGAASGIGRAIALALAREGAALSLLDIDEAGLDETAAAVRGAGAEAHAHACDLTRPEQLRASVDAILQRWPAIEILVNNAGCGFYGRYHEMTPAQRDRMMTVNLLAPMQVTHLLLPTLMVQPDAHILNVCSAYGVVAGRKTAAYSASKAGLVHFSLSLYMEYSRGGPGVTALCPSFVDTPMFDRSLQVEPGTRGRRPPAWLVIPPEKVARRALRAIRRRHMLVVMPAYAGLLWRLTRLHPKLVYAVGFRRSFTPPAPGGAGALSGPNTDAA